MAALQIRSLPPEVYEALAEEAKKQRRSINQQAIVTLKRGLRDTSHIHKDGSMDAEIFDGRELRPIPAGYNPDDDPEEIARNKARRRAVLEEIRALPKIEFPPGYPSAVEMIREDRER